MFGPTSDEYGLLLTREQGCAKCIPVTRSTFRTLSDIPIAMVSRNDIKCFHKDYNKRRKDQHVQTKAVFEEKISLLYYYPNMKPDIIYSLIEKGYKGIVIAGTGARGM